MSMQNRHSFLDKLQEYQSIRTFLTFFLVSLLTVVITSCQAPPPNMSPVEAPRTQSPITNQSKVPVGVTYSWQRPEGFDLLNYPGYLDAALPNIPKMFVQMKYPVSTYYGMPTAETFNKDTPYDGLAYFLVTRAWAKTALNRTIATQMDFGITIDVREGVYD